MSTDQSFIDQLIQEKRDRPAMDVVGTVRDWYKKNLGAELPVDSMGLDDFHRRMRLEHSRAFDVGLRPDSNEGRQLISFLESQGIPYLAFSHAIPGQATGPHIHVGPPSSRLTAENDPTNNNSFVDQLLQEKSGSFIDQMLAEKAKPVDRRGEYGSRAMQAVRGGETGMAALDKLAHDIEWHFGYSVLQAMPTLPVEKQREIIEKATEFAKEDEKKRANGVEILKSPAWQLQNQQAVHVVAGKDIEARTPPEVDIAQRAAFRAGANPLVQYLPDPPTWLKVLIPSLQPRAAAETLIKGAGGLFEAGAGIARLSSLGGRNPKSTVVANELQRMAADAREMAEQSQAASGRGELTKTVQDVGAGVVTYAPLALLPEIGFEGVMARIGSAALTGGAYTGAQAIGRGEGAKQVGKEALTGGATFGLLGVPLPGKNILLKGLSNLVITGGGTVLLNKATGQPTSEAIKQGVVMTLLRSPELWNKIPVREADGTERPATIKDIRGLLPAAKFTLETNRPEPTGPATVHLPAKQTGVVEKVAPETQGELFTATRPGAQAGREDLPGFNPTPMSLEAYAQSKGMDVGDPLTHQFYKEYLDKVKSTAGQPAAAPPKYAQWAKEAQEAEDAWNHYKETEGASENVDAKVKDAIKFARENGPSPEFRAFFAGIEPRLAGTTIKAVAAFAKKLGIKWEAQAGWAEAEKEATQAAAPPPTAAPEEIKWRVERPTGLTAKEQEWFDWAESGAKDVLDDEDWIRDNPDANTLAGQLEDLRQRLEDQAPDLVKQGEGAGGGALRSLLAKLEKAKFFEAEPMPQTRPLRGILGAAPGGTAEAPPPEATAAQARRQQAVGGTPQPQQMEFATAGMTSEGTPIFDSRAEDPQAALVRLQRLRLDPEIWGNLSKEDRRSIGKAIADLKSGKTPAQILDEQALSSQYQGQVNLSEETARTHLKTLEDLKKSEMWRTLSDAQQKAVDAQIERLRGQGAGELPEVAKPKAARPPSLGLSTRERLEATPAQLADVTLNRDFKLAQERFRAARGTRGTLDARVDKIFEEHKRESISSRLGRFIRSETGSVPDLDELRRMFAEKTQDLGDVEKPRERETTALEGANRYVDDLAYEQAMYDSLSQEIAADTAAERRQGLPSDVIDLTDQDVDFKQKVKNFLADEEGSFKPEELKKRIRELIDQFPDASDDQIKTMLRREGESGAASLGAISLGAAQKLNQVRNTITTLVRNRVPRDVMVYTRDRGDSAAMIYGQNIRNDVEGPLREAVGSTRLSRDALSFVVESRGNQNALAQMRATILGSQQATPGWRQRALRAIDYAEQHYAQLRPVAQLYDQKMQDQLANENANGLDTLNRGPGYVMHAQELGEAETLLTPRGGTDGSLGFRRNRVHDTFADSIAAGVNPKSLDALDLLSSRISNGQRALNRRQWLADLRNTNDPRTGNPIVTDPIMIQRADGTSYPQAPQGYSPEKAGYENIAVHNGYEGLYSALTDQNRFTQNAAARSFLTANGTGKSIALMIDTFHLGRLAFWESLIKALGVRTFTAPVPSFVSALRTGGRMRGVTLLDTTIPEIQNMAQRGEIPQSWLNNLAENKRRINLLVDHGFNVGMISDALYQDIIHSIPVAGPFNKWLFSQYQRSAMTEVGLLEFERRRAARPNEPEAVTARNVAKDLNIRFGNLGRQGLFKSRTGQDLARAVALAPQWNEGLVRSEVGALTQAGRFIGDTVQGRRLYAGVLLRSVGAMAVGQFVANQLINMITRGHPTWENPEEGWGAKLSAYIPDISGGPGFFLHPMGLAAETTHLLMKGYERTGDFTQSLNDYVRSRSSAAMRPILTFLTRRDYLGRSLKPGTVWNEIVKSAVPLPIPARALAAGLKQVYTGKPEEEFPGQFQRQVMSSIGVRTEPVPSGEKRIRDLARHFNESKGIEPSGEFYAGPYQKLTLMLGTKGAPDALKELLKEKSREQIMDYYDKRVNAYLTGKEDREREFLKTLNPEQKQQYDKVKQQRRKDFQQVLQLLRTKSSSAAAP